MRTDTIRIEPKLLRIIDQAKQQPLESSLEPGVLQQGGHGGEGGRSLEHCVLVESWLLLSTDAADAPL